MLFQGSTDILPANIFVFPQTLNDKTGAGITTGNSYSPNHFLDNILTGSSPQAIDQIGDILVSKAYYYKSQKGAEHEFLVFQVSFGEATNYLKLDRFPQRELPGPPKSIRDEGMGDQSAQGTQPRDRPNAGITLQPSGSAASVGSSGMFGEHLAQDLFRVSSTGKLDQLVEECPNSVSLATLEFPTGSEFSLEELLTLATVVSKHRPKYDLFRSQCYWYAFTIWNLMKQLCPSAIQKPATLEAAGTHSKVPWIAWYTREEAKTDSPAEVRGSVENDASDVMKSYRSAWEEFKSKLSEVKKGGKQARLELERQIEDAKRQAGEDADRAKEEAARAKEEAARAKEEAARAKEEAARAEKEAARAEKEARLKEQAERENAALRQQIHELQNTRASSTNVS